MEMLIPSVHSESSGLKSAWTSCVDSSRLKAGLVARQSISELITETGLAPVEVVAALAVAGLELNEGLGPSLVTKGRGALEWKPFLSMDEWKKLFPRASQTELLNLLAGLLQIFDFWDESHEMAQASGDLGDRQVSSSWHAICHRREPDPGNAQYWLNRAGNNPVGEKIVERLNDELPRLSSLEAGIAGQLVRNGKFQDRAFVDLATRARSGSDEEKFLQKVQKIEMIFLIGLCLERLN